MKIERYPMSADASSAKRDYKMIETNKHERVYTK